MIPDAAAIRIEMLRQLQARGVAKSICPSEVARALAPEWHGLMKRVRDVAITLMREGRIDILRKGRPVALAAVEPQAGAEIKGVIRLRLRPDPA
ncbi:DUF3253 domain-containing protein [Lichenicoccus sp.]|uniref:DUF3253 domain-containing protein n=1 Tax=Lichenicoccus sp. TaxID=2781899 RepID=UPI003D0E57A0